MSFLHKGWGNGSNTTGPINSTPQAPPTPTGGPAYADYDQYDPFWTQFNTKANTQIKSEQERQLQGLNGPYQFSGGGSAPSGDQGTAGEGGHWEMVGGENAETRWIPDPVKMTIDESKIPAKYKGLWKANTDTSPQANPWIKDTSKLPKIKVGGVELDRSEVSFLGTDKKKGPDWSQIKGPTRDPRNKDMVHWDDNYGWVTPTKNLYSKEDVRDEKLMQAMQMAASFAMPFAAVPGAAGIPGLAMSSIGAAKTFGDSGNWKAALMNILPGLIGAGMSSGGFNFPKLPPELAQALKYAQYAKQGYGMYKGLRG